MNEYEKKNARLAALDLDHADVRVRCPLCGERVATAGRLRAHQRTKRCQYEASRRRVARLGLVQIESWAVEDLSNAGIHVEVVKGYGRGYNSGTRRSYSHPWVAIIFNATGLNRKPRYRGLALAMALLDESFRKALLAVDSLGGRRAVGKFILERFEQPATRDGGPMCSTSQDAEVSCVSGSDRSRGRRASWTDIDLENAVEFMRRSLEGAA